MRDYKAPHDQTEPGLPIIAIPTTAGTGSEATRYTIVTDEETEEKMLCIGLAYLPVAALVDFELSMTKPMRLTADTGVDSLTHAIEAYVSRRANAFSDSFALSAMRAIWINLPSAYFEPYNRAAREAMMLAATQAGIAFSNSSVASGARDEPSDRGEISRAARDVERDAVAGGDRVLDFGGRSNDTPNAPG